MHAAHSIIEAPDPAAARTERHLRTLAELAEIGMDLAREVRRQALDETADAPPAGELALTFSRIARAVRQTVALEAKLAEPPQPGQAERPPLGVSDRWRSARRKRQVKQIVGQIIEAVTDTDFQADRLFAERDERLDDGDDEDADFAERPIGELVARICRDLGVTPDWSLLEDEDWAIEENLLSPAQREGEGRERAGAGFAAASPGPAGPDPEQVFASPSG
jgi:hypothetical protein